MQRHYLPIFIIAVLANLLGYWIKIVIKKNGYTVKFFSGFFRDIKNIFKLAKSSNDRNVKIKSLILGYSEIGLTITFVVLGIGLFLSLPSLNDGACNRFKDFKSYKYDYLVINKYLDSNEHSYPTLILQDGKGDRFQNQDLIDDNSGLFQFLSVGDSIQKRKGDSVVNVIRNKLDTTIKVNFGCGYN